MWTWEMRITSGSPIAATSTWWWRRRWATRGVSAGSVSTLTPATSITALACPSHVIAGPTSVDTTPAA